MEWIQMMTVMMLMMIRMMMMMVMTIMMIIHKNTTEMHLQNQCFLMAPHYDHSEVEWTATIWIWIVSPWWRHQMEIFSAFLALCAGNSPVTTEFTSQRPVTRSFDVFLSGPWINDWINNHESGDFRRNRAHYDVIVMIALQVSTRWHSSHTQ